ncbi:MAG: hypothetical protein IPH76_18685 [Xanthomonadales bacterium]|nr:hypothetical protein [Xanthomonadales bacterium]
MARRGWPFRRPAVAPAPATDATGMVAQLRLRLRPRCVSGARIRLQLDPARACSPIALAPCRSVGNGWLALRDGQIKVY